MDELVYWCEICLMSKLIQLPGFFHFVLRALKPRRVYASLLVVAALQSPLAFP